MDFHQIKIFGCAVAPPPPTPLAPASKNFHTARVDARKSRFASNTPDPFCPKC